MSLLGELWSGPEETLPSIDSASVQRKISEGLRRIELQLKRQGTADLIGDYASRFKGTGLDFAEVREYQPGDDRRLIHWKVTARLGRSFVKTYQEERKRRVIIALDCSRSMLVGMKYERAVELTAFLGLLFRKTGDPFGVVTFGDTVQTVLPPSSNRLQPARVLHTLIDQREFSSSTDLRSIADFLGSIRKRSLVFLLSDFTPIPPERADLIPLRKHLTQAIYFPDPVESFPVRQGLFQFQEAEGRRSRSLARIPLWRNKKGSRREQEARAALQRHQVHFTRAKDTPQETVRSLLKMR